jgi:hypothetical protein
VKEENAMAPAPQPALGRGNPKVLGAGTVELLPCDGIVHSPADFARQHLGLLNRREQSVLLAHLDRLEYGPLPTILTSCVSRSRDIAGSNVPVIVARRSGGRSAFVPEGSLKFKGCRPVLDASTYPLEVLPRGATCVSRTTIPFGTLTHEAVLRELLGYSFVCEHQAPVHARPVCVYEYRHERQMLGYCLVLESRGEDRIEAHVEYPCCSVTEIVCAKQSGLADADGTPFGSELRLRDVNPWWYAETKSRLLCDMHFDGGSRGILNSNIGNDVLMHNGSDNPQLCLCDFDSFHIVAIPQSPTKEFIRDFVLHAMIEVIKGSLSIFDYLEIPPHAALSAVAQTLGNVYFSKSSLWHAYVRRFERAARLRGWDQDTVRGAIEAARRTDAAADVLSSCIVNSHYLRTMSRDRRVYYPHN